MIASMTAFARRSNQQEWGTLTWEIRSVNHRFLEINVKLPEFMRELELPVRTYLSSNLSRGKIEAFLRFNQQESFDKSCDVNVQLLTHLSKMSQEILKYFPEARADLLGLLSWPGMIKSQSTDSEQIYNATIELLQLTTKDLIKARQNEGSQTREYILLKLKEIFNYVESISQDLPKLLNLERQRITDRLREISLQLDQQRIEQEMALLIQKTDVAEEIQRLRGHCQTMQTALNQTGAVGRRLDFLSQELHREANTLGNKALALSLIQASLEIKVLIEQIREQVQNIE